MTCADNRALVNIAPVAATDKVIIPEKIVEDVYECYREGAAMVYLHVRDKGGRLTSDMSLPEETLAVIRRDSDIIIEVSIGGVSNLNIQERYAPLYSEVVEAYSPNVGFTDLGRDVYCSPIGDVEYCTREILKQRKTPKVEAFEIGHTWTMGQLMKKYDFADPTLFNIVLSHEREAPAVPQALATIIQVIPSDVMWGITQAHRKDFSLLVDAAGMGVRTTRIGFEDSSYLDPRAQTTSDAPLVEETVRLLQAMDKEPTRSGETRALLGIGR